MYVCLCNAITDRMVRALIDRECRTVSMIYRALETRPKCGKCVRFLQQLLRQEAEDRRAASDPAIGASLL